MTRTLKGVDPTGGAPVVWIIQGRTEHMAYVLQEKDDGSKRIRWASTGGIAWIGPETVLRKDLGGRSSRRRGAEPQAQIESKPMVVDTVKRSRRSASDPNTSYKEEDSFEDDFGLMIPDSTTITSGKKGKGSPKEAESKQIKAKLQKKRKKSIKTGKNPEKAPPLSTTPKRKRAILEDSDGEAEGTKSKPSRRSRRPAIEPVNSVDDSVQVDEPPTKPEAAEVDPKPAATIQKIVASGKSRMAKLNPPSKEGEKGSTKKGKAVDIVHAAVLVLADYGKGTRVAKKIGTGGWISGRVKAATENYCTIQWESRETDFLAKAAMTQMVYDADTTRYTIKTKVKKHLANGKVKKGRVHSLENSLYHILYNDGSTDVVGTSEMDELVANYKGQKNKSATPAAPMAVVPIDEVKQSAGQSTESEATKRRGVGAKCLSPAKVDDNKICGEKAASWPSKMSKVDKPDPSATDLTKKPNPVGPGKEGASSKPSSRDTDPGLELSRKPARDRPDSTRRASDPPADILATSVEARGAKTNSSDKKASSSNAVEAEAIGENGEIGNDVNESLERLGDRTPVFTKKFPPPFAPSGSVKDDAKTVQEETLLRLSTEVSKDATPLDPGLSTTDDASVQVPAADDILPQDSTHPSKDTSHLEIVSLIIDESTLKVAASEEKTPLGPMESFGVDSDPSGQVLPELDTVARLPAASVAMVDLGASFSNENVAPEQLPPPLATGEKVTRDQKLPPDDVGATDPLPLLSPANEKATQDSKEASVENDQVGTLLKTTNHSTTSEQVPLAAADAAIGSENNSVEKVKTGVTSVDRAESPAETSPLCIASTSKPAVGEDGKIWFGMEVDEVERAKGESRSSVLPGRSPAVSTGERPLDINPSNLPPSRGQKTKIKTTSTELVSNTNELAKIDDSLTNDSNESKPTYCSVAGSSDQTELPVATSDSSREGITKETHLDVTGAGEDEGAQKLSLEDALGESVAKSSTEVDHPMHTIAIENVASTSNVEEKKPDTGNNPSTQGQMEVDYPLDAAIGNKKQTLPHTSAGKGKSSCEKATSHSIEQMSDEVNHECARIMDCNWKGFQELSLGEVTRNASSSELSATGKERPKLQEGCAISGPKVRVAERSGLPSPTVAESRILAPSGQEAEILCRSPSPTAEVVLPVTWAKDISMSTDVALPCVAIPAVCEKRVALAEENPHTKAKQIFSLLPSNGNVLSGGEVSTCALHASPPSTTMAARASSDSILHVGMEGKASIGPSAEDARKPQNPFPVATAKRKIPSEELRPRKTRRKQADDDDDDSVVFLSTNPSRMTAVLARAATKGAANVNILSKKNQSRSVGAGASAISGAGALSVLDKALNNGATGCISISENKRKIPSEELRPSKTRRKHADDDGDDSVVFLSTNPSKMTAFWARAATKGAANVNILSKKNQSQSVGASATARAGAVSVLEKALNGGTGCISISEKARNSHTMSILDKAQQASASGAESALDRALRATAAGSKKIAPQGNSAHSNGPTPNQADHPARTIWAPIDRATNPLTKAPVPQARGKPTSTRQTSLEGMAQVPFPVAGSGTYPPYMNHLLVAATQGRVPGYPHPFYAHRAPFGAHVTAGSQPNITPAACGQDRILQRKARSTAANGALRLSSSETKYTTTGAGASSSETPQMPAGIFDDCIGNNPSPTVALPVAQQQAYAQLQNAAGAANSSLYFSLGRPGASVTPGGFSNQTIAGINSLTRAFYSGSTAMGNQPSANLVASAYLGLLAPQYPLDQAAAPADNLASYFQYNKPKPGTDPPGDTPPGPIRRRR